MEPGLWSWWDTELWFVLFEGCADLVEVDPQPLGFVVVDLEFLDAEFQLVDGFESGTTIPHEFFTMMGAGINSFVSSSKTNVMIIIGWSA